MAAFSKEPIPGHCRFIVEMSRSHDCMSVFEAPGIPRIGTLHDGRIVSEIQATWLGGKSYLLDVRADEVCNG